MGKRHSVVKYFVYTVESEGHLYLAHSGAPFRTKLSCTLRVLRGQLLAKPAVDQKLAGSLEHDIRNFPCMRHPPLRILWIADPDILSLHGAVLDTPTRLHET